MIKNTIAIFAILYLFSCSKKNVENNLDSEAYTPTKYDTVAVDSFSTGATSVDIAAQIRRSSIAYQDSARKQKIATDIAAKELEDKRKMETLEKEKLAAEKKKEGEKKVE